MPDGLSWRITHTKSATGKSIGQSIAACLTSPESGNWMASIWQGASCGTRENHGAARITSKNEVSRRSRTPFWTDRKLSRRSSKELAETAIQALHDYPLETITPDRGSEFRYHDRVTEGGRRVVLLFAAAPPVAVEDKREYCHMLKGQGAERTSRPSGNYQQDGLRADCGYRPALCGNLQDQL